MKTLAQAIATMEGFYTPGTRAQRNNNPGNIEFGGFAQSCGSLRAESQGRFAVFPSADAGFHALETLLLSSAYRDLSVQQAIHRYAPPSENDTTNYVQQVCRWCGCQPTDRVADVVNRTVTGLHASGHEHLSLPMLLWAVAGGVVKSASRWLFDRYGHPLLVRLHRAWDDAAPTPTAPGEPMTPHDQQTTSGTVNDLQANAVTDFFKNLLTGKLFTKDQQKKIGDGVTTFVMSDVGALALDSVLYVKAALPGATSVELRDAAKAKLKADAATAGHDLSTMSGSFLNWAIETALQYALSKGLAAVATAAAAAL